MQNFDSLFHADQAKSLALPGCFQVESFACVADRKMDLFGCSLQQDFDVSCPTVFCRIVQSFLKNAEKGERDVAGQVAGQSLDLEANRNVLLL